MTQSAGSDRSADQACRLLQEYSFDLDGYRPSGLVLIWQEQLEAESSWICSAVVEALYQGRYKAFSVEQILRVWKRRGHPIRHFNHDFERVILGPIDPTASKYASMTSASPSELLKPRQETKRESVSQAAARSKLPASTPTFERSQPYHDSTLPAPPPLASASTPAVKIESAHRGMATGDRAIARDYRMVKSPRSDASSMMSLISLPRPKVASSFAQQAPIQKFVPQPAPSDFYARLQTVARYS